MPNIKLELSAALSDNPRTRPIIDGEIQPDGIRLIPSVVHPSEMFWRQLRYRDFDVSEMSLSSLFISTARGDNTWVAIPIYTMRHFFHTGIRVRTDRGIDTPADLKGKRVGVPEYQQTSAIWSRGILQHEFGVSPQDMEWFMERGPERSHGAATGFVPPEGVRLNQISPEKNIGTMLASGELDAAIHYIANQNLVDRSHLDFSTVAEVKMIFSDPVAEGQRYHAKTGIYPINHTVVVRRSLIDRHPWVALNLYKAFVAAKESGRTAAIAALLPHFETGQLDETVKKSIDIDQLPYSVKAETRIVLETIAQYVHEQGLTPRRVNIDEIFAPSTLDI